MTALLYSLLEALQKIFVCAAPLCLSSRESCLYFAVTLQLGLRKLIEGTNEDTFLLHAHICKWKNEGVCLFSLYSHLRNDYLSKQTSEWEISLTMKFPIKFKINQSTNHAWSEERFSNETQSALGGKSRK